LTDISASF